MSDVLISPSILAADCGKFAQEIQAISQLGADWVHFDIMDGHFVPPITFGPEVVAAAKKVSSAFLDVHLMITNPELQIGAFANAGADLITVHIEACPHLHRIVQEIHHCGKKAGVALNPGTPVQLLCNVIEDIDLVLVMSVNPGWAGQKFLPFSVAKIRECRGLIKQSGHAVYLQVDGGINTETGKLAREAGADVLVAGSYIFRHKNYGEAINSLKA